MPELTSAQTAVLERLVERGFRLVAFPLYASAIGVRRDLCAALLVPAERNGLQLLGRPCYLIDGNLTVQIQRGGSQYFVWKTQSLEATPERLAQLSEFSNDLQSALSAAPR